MRRWLFGLILVLAVFGSVTALSYTVINHFYGVGYLITSTQNIVIENSGQQVNMDNVEYRVASVEPGNNENFYLLNCRMASADSIQGWQYENDYTYTPVTAGYVPSPAPPLSFADTGAINQISVPTGAYEQAQRGDPVTVSNNTTTETKPIDASPIAATIGIAMSVMALAVWAGYRQMWGDATSTLLEQGLNDMTVRDVEIVGYIMEMGEFTIPELIKTTEASKITVWRTVQKLVEKGLVQQTEKTKLASSGLGGRGKPSGVYKYVGAKNEHAKK